MAGRPLKVGIQLPEVEREVRWPELLDMIRAIEDLGFDSIWLGEHLLYRWEDRPPRGPWEAWSLMAAIAATTTRVEFGPFVACTSFHNPALLAKQAATIDEISGGRLILGLGAGWNETEFRAFGFPYDHRVDRFEEAFTIIRTLLGEGAIDFDGRYYQARDCELLPPSARPGGPPLLIGSNGPRMLRIALPYASAWNTLVRGRRQRAGGHRPAAGGRGRGVPGRWARSRPRSSGPWRSWSACPAARAVCPAMRPMPPSRRCRATRRRWPMGSAPMPAKGSGPSSWSWTRSPCRRSRRSPRR